MGFRRLFRRIKGFSLRLCALALLWLATSLLNCDTAFCKMQQSIDIPDPFEEIIKDNPDLFKPVLTESSKKSRKQEFVNPQELVGSSTNSSSRLIANGRALNQIDVTQLDDRLRERTEELKSTKLSNIRPVYPQRTKPGGPVSSCSIESTMTADQEAFLYSQLEKYVDTSWQDWTVADLHSYLNTILPTYLNSPELENEGVPKDAKIEAKYSCAGPLHVRLRDALKPLALTAEVRRGRLEITTESNVADGDGSLRVYDVTPLVSRVHGGAEQLQNTIEISIAPDSWLRNGGNSTLQFHVIPCESDAATTLVVGTTTSVHRQVQDLLDRLNLLTASGSANSKKFSPTAPVTADWNDETHRHHLDERVRGASGF